MISDCKGFIVALDKDMKSEDVDDAIRLLKSIRGVVGVQSVDADPMGDSIQRMRIRNELRRKILDLFE
jgi:hypothetical protein